MQLLFVDESGSIPKRGSIVKETYFILGGLVIPEDFWHKIRAELEIVKTRYKIQGEIKWRYFAPENPDARPHALSHLNSVDKENLRASLFQIITKYKSVKIMSVVTDITSAYSKPFIENADEIFWESYKKLTERFQYYLQDISRTAGSKTNGIIICDHRAPKDDKRLQELHAGLLRSRDPYSATYKNLIEGVFIAPSHLSVGVQLADMVAGAILRKFKAADDRFFNQIKSSIRCSQKGDMEGYGIIKYPKN